MDKLSEGETQKYMLIVAALGEEPMARRERHVVELLAKWLHRDDVDTLCLLIFRAKRASQA